MINTKIQSIFFFVLLIATIGILLIIFYPFLGPLVLALTLAIVFKPIYRWLLSHTRKSEGLSSFITILLIIAIVIIPLSLIAANIFSEIGQVYNNYQSDDYSGLFGQLSSDVKVIINQYLPWWTVDFATIKQQLVGWIFGKISVIFSSAITISFGLFIMLISLFYLFKDGHNFKVWARQLSPLSSADEDQLINKLEKTIRSVVGGSLLIGIAQGIATGVGFTLFDVPQPILWGTVAALAALVPTLGTALVNIPAIIYLLITGQYLMALGLTLWALIFVNLLDNLLGPKLIQRGIKIHPLLILLSVLGGLSFFGPLGFILGPIILSLSVSLLDIYSADKTPEAI